jgi:hypothetical protein
LTANAKAPSRHGRVQLIDARERLFAGATSTLMILTLPAPGTPSDKESG